MSEENAQRLLKKMRHWLRLDKFHPTIRKVVVGIVGGIFFVAGIIMLVTPGPAIVFIPLGLLLLASEFKWAERWMQRATAFMNRWREKWRERKRRRAAIAKP
jgi:uncharacterized protein (TIGR02611 family)